MLTRPFKAIRPAREVVHEVAALPYDVYTREEAKTAVDGHPLSFLNIDRPETQFDISKDMYAPEVNRIAKRLFEQAQRDGVFIQDNEECYYLYELIMEKRSQTGIVACCSIDEYETGVIKKHEHTIKAKEQDRVDHIMALDAQTGPIFLTYRDSEVLNNLVFHVKTSAPLYDFITSDGIVHRVWRIADDETIRVITDAFVGVSNAYIADGHHRCASAVRVGKAKREQSPTKGGNMDELKPCDVFMSVLFPESQLRIMPYNRVVYGLNGLTKDEFLERLGNVYDVLYTQRAPLEPINKGALAMYLDGVWYSLGVKEEYESNDAVEGLDVAILQKYVLGPVLGINDPRSNKRIQFVGGIHPSTDLEKYVDAATDMAVAFVMYAPTMQELMKVADAHKVMPPKSTWFEPKLRSGLFIYSLA